MSIGKNGVWKQSGSPNPNIFPEAQSSEVQYVYPTTGTYKDYLSKQTSIIPSSSQYTLSFYAKSTVNGDKIRSHYYNPNTTTTCVSSQGVNKTAADGNMDFTLTTEWIKYWVTYTQTETTAKKWIIFPRLMVGGGTGTISVKEVKFEEGPVATDWIPCEGDNLYVGAFHSFIEKEEKTRIQKNDYIEANSFIEL